MEAVRVVGERWSQRSQEMRSLLERYGIPFTFLVADAPEGRRLLAEVGVSGQRLPVLLLFDGRVLVDPEYFEVADAFGANAEIGGEREDLTIVGAGPAGLAAAVYGASEGLDTLVLDDEAIGGQAGPVPASATTSASRGVWAAASWHNARTCRPGCSVRGSTSSGRDRRFVRRAIGSSWMLRAWVRSRRGRWSSPLACVTRGLARQFARSAWWVPASSTAASGAEARAMVEKDV